MTQLDEHGKAVAEVINIIVDAVNLHHIDKSQITSETPLTQGGLELDSVDILEVIVVLEQRFGVKVPDPETGRKYFQTIGTVAEFVRTKPTARPAV
jgi:acyl carrier protein